jgi:hypothetical protein
MTALNIVYEELRHLAPNELSKAARFVHELRLTAKSDRAEVVDRTAGSLKGELGESLAKAIEDGCERIDANGW